MIAWLVTLGLAAAAPVEVRVALTEGAVVGVEDPRARTPGDLERLAESAWFGKRGTTPLRVGEQVAPDLEAWTARADRALREVVGERDDLELELVLMHLSMFRSTAAVLAELEVHWTVTDPLGAVVAQGLAKARAARSQGAVPALDEVFDEAVGKVVASQVLREAFARPPALGGIPAGPVAGEACAATAVTGLRESVRGVVVLRTDSAVGTGVVISPDGLVVTAGHVVRDARTVVARFGDGTELPAALVRAAPDADLALLRVEGADLPCLLPRGAPAELGEDLYAIGTPGGEALAFSMSRGIVSGVREVGSLRVVQTDAALNAGNSGGPLVDPAGGWLAVAGFKLVGRGVEGLAFGVSALDALRVLGVDGLQGAAP